MTARNVTPELDRLAALAVEQACLQEFFEWLSSKRYEVCGWVDGHRFPQPLLQKPDDLIYEYLGIDPMKLERERRWLLENARQREEADRD